MPDFTPEQIRDAREHPKPGDVWRITADWHRTVKSVHLGVVWFFADVGSARDLHSIPLEQWARGLERCCTLLRRGA